MAKVETRRLAPVGWITAILVGLLFIVELLVMSGAVELRAATVAKYAPWAYEPFLKLVGEYPQAQPGEPLPEKQGVDQDAPAGLAEMAGISPDALKVNLDVEIPEESERPAEDTRVEPAAPETNAIPKIVPVG